MVWGRAFPERRRDPVDSSLGRCSEDGAAMVVDVDGDGGCVVVKFCEKRYDDGAQRCL